MKVAFQDTSFAFEFVRNLGFAYYGGSDLGEMIAQAGTIKEGDFESWFEGWDFRARRLLTRADADFHAGHLISAREGYLRASTYFRMAEFYLHGNPGDPRILSESTASQDAYSRGAELMGPTWQPVAIPYEGTTLPGYFYTVDDSGEPRPTLVFHGGLDSSVEELYYFAAAAAVRRGYNCLTWDGPGQGMPLRTQKLYHRYDWEKVVTPAVDYLGTRSDVDMDKLALMGMSLGGYFAARAAAFEHRFKAVILYNGMFSFHESTRGAMPKDAMAALNEGDTLTCEQIIYREMQNDTMLRWTVTQGLYSFGASSIVDYLTAKTEKYTMKGIGDQIRCPTLIMNGTGDTLEGGDQAQEMYDAMTAPRELMTFTAEDGAEEHVEAGALAYVHEAVFNWLDETLGLSGPDPRDRGPSRSR